MYRTVTDVCLAAEAAAKEGRVSNALQLIAEFVGDIISREATLGRVMSSRDLDRVCLELGRGPACQSGDENPEQAVYVLTAIYGIGGHTRVLLDLAGADRSTNVNVLLTNVYHDHSRELIEATIKSIGAPPHI